MAWAPKYTAEFEGRLIDNILALVTRDMKFALDYFYPADALPDFAERCLSYPIGLNFPMLVIDPSSSAIDDVEGTHLQEAVRYTLEIGVTDSDAELVTRRCMKYVRALDAVLRTGAIEADYFAGYTATNVGGLSVDVSHEFGTPGVNPKGLYFRPASLDLTVMFKEL